MVGKDVLSDCQLLLTAVFYYVKLVEEELFRLNFVSSSSEITFKFGLFTLRFGPNDTMLKNQASSGEINFPQTYRWLETTFCPSESCFFAAVRSGRFRA